MATSWRRSWCSTPASAACQWSRKNKPIGSCNGPVQQQGRGIMQRRAFIATAATAVAVAPFVTPAGAAPPRPGPVLLTVSGAIANGNRGPRDALDQLMHKHGIDFKRAQTLDHAALATLPTVS